MFKSKEQKMQELELKMKKQEMKDLKNAARCPKCKSTSLSSHKKGYGVAKGVVGGLAGVALTGPVGLVGLATGNLGAKKVKVTCMNCGKQFKP